MKHPFEQKKECGFSNNPTGRAFQQDGRFVIG